MQRKRGKTPAAAPSDGAGVQRLVEELHLLRGLVDLLPEGVVIQEPTGEIVFSNQALQNLCGGAVPATFAELAGLVRRGELASELGDAGARARLTPGVFLDDLRAGNLHLTVSSRTVGRDAHGLRLWSFVDRSGEVGAEETQRVQAVDIFAKGIAHNFNAILGGISEAIDALEDITGDDTRAKRCVGLTRACVDKGTTLTRKMASPRPAPPGDEVSAALDDVVRSVVAVQEVLQGGRVEFELFIPPNLPPVGMPWDSLVGVIQSLVVNSVEAIEAVGRVKISAEVLTPPHAVTVKVEDTGGGMDEATLKRVFEPFFSTKALDYHRGIPSSGSGLGLWNVYRAVKSVGGTVAMRSQVGRGTTVEVTIPISSGE